MAKIVNLPSGAAALAQNISIALRAFDPRPPAERVGADPVGALAATLVEVLADQAEMRRELDELRALAKPEPGFAPSGYEPIGKLAERLGLSVETIRLWCVNGSIASCRRAGGWHASRRSTMDYARRER
jgi:hypothetical protein